MDPMLAQIMMFGGNFAPRGWAFCDGQLLPISQYTALFSIIGTTYGGDGRTTFALPDLRGRAPIHAGTGPGLSTRKIGQKFGTQEDYLNVTQLPSHNHLASNVNVDIKVSSATASLETPIAGSSLAAGVQTEGRTSTPVSMYNTETPDITLSGTSTPITIGNTGGNLPVNNMQPSLVVNYIIALQGVFPSRS